MRNSPRLPVISLILAAVLTVVVVVVSNRNGRFPLTEIELGTIGLIIALVIYGIQGLISVALEGEELEPGRRGPRLTDQISVAIILFSLALFAIALALAWGIAGEWQTRTLGILAGAGSVILALLLVLYKEAFIGEEATFDNREDGVPW